MSSQNAVEQSSTDRTHPYEPDNLGRIEVVADECRTGHYARIPLPTSVLDALGARNAERVSAEEDAGDVILRTGPDGDLGDWAAIHQTKLGPTVVDALGVAPGDEIVAHDDGDVIRLEAEVEVINEQAFVACGGVNSGTHKSLHTERDCQRLKQANDVREATQGELQSRDWCDFCLGLVNQSDPDLSVYNAAVSVGENGGGAE